MAKSKVLVTHRYTINRLYTKDFQAFGLGQLDQPKKFDTVIHNTQKS